MIDYNSKNGRKIIEQANEIRALLRTIENFNEWCGNSFYINALNHMTQSFIQDKDRELKMIEDAVFVAFNIAEYITKLKEDFDRIIELHPELVK